MSAAVRYNLPADNEQSSSPSRPAYTTRQSLLAIASILAIGCATSAPRLARRNTRPPSRRRGHITRGDSLRPCRCHGRPPALRQRLAEARADVERDASNVDALIWLGRRTAVLGNYREAIEIFTGAIARAPKDARLYAIGPPLPHGARARLAITDFERAAFATAGALDEGGAGRTPERPEHSTSTLQSTSGITSAWRITSGVTHPRARRYRAAGPSPER